MTNDAGICGEPSAELIYPGGRTQVDICCLKAGHEGWHHAGDNHDWTTERMNVRKIAHTVPISCCMARSYGMDVECIHVAAPPLKRRTRLRWWLANRWARRPHVHFGPCDHEDC